MDADDVAEVWKWTRDLLPLPGHGETEARFEALAEIAFRDLCVAKLVEPHHDSAAILAEPWSCSSPEAGSLWAVWAAELPAARLRARYESGGWWLSGKKAFCSGATLVTHALITASSEGESRLFAVNVESGRLKGRSTWPRLIGWGRGCGEPRQGPLSCGVSAASRSVGRAAMSAGPDSGMEVWGSWPAG